MVTKLKLKLWRRPTKGDEFTMAGGVKTWDLGDPRQRAAFVEVSRDGLWIEGLEPSAAEGDVRFDFTFDEGEEHHSDFVRATVVMINLANAVYRDNELWFFPGAAQRGHAAIVWWFDGPCTRENLLNDDKFRIIEIAGPTDNKTLTTITAKTPKGCYTHPEITYVQRLRILAAARSLVGKKFPYTAFNTLLPKNWDGALNTIKELRCDGLIEACYEINGVDVWAKLRTPTGTLNYKISSQDDDWAYNASTGEYTPGRNKRPDNLEEHNDFDSPDWEDTLMPATQAGYVKPEDADTRFRKMHLCLPIGSKGGN